MACDSDSRIGHMDIEETQTWLHEKITHQIIIINRWNCNWTHVSLLVY